MLRVPTVLVLLSSHSGPIVRVSQAAFSTATFASLYFALADAGISMVVATPAGGQASMTRVTGTLTGPAMPDRFRRDTHGRDMFADTLTIDQIFASDFAAMIAVSAVDGLWDLVEDDSAARVAGELFGLGRPVALVGHAAGILCRSPSPVAPMRGRGVTGAS